MIVRFLVAAVALVLLGCGGDDAPEEDVRAVEAPSEAECEAAVSGAAGSGLVVDGQRAAEVCRTGPRFTAAFDRQDSSVTLPFAVSSACDLEVDFELRTVQVSGPAGDTPMCQQVKNCLRYSLDEPGIMNTCVEGLRG